MSAPSFSFSGRDLVLVQCFSCSIEYAIPNQLYRNALDSRGAHSRNIHCPNGHAWHYIGESEADKQRRRAERAEQQIAARDDEIAALGKRHLSQITRMKKRASAGTCPCCNRTFQNVSTHMKRQHPEFVEEQGTKVVPIKRRRASR